ncbi:hypothetical protein GJ698_00435 [Pseudoduganella sp. FT26W]|uniref:Tail specific protease domain-containing protein n=1 Tax=Duganella aquatilis TaxID=2666082 RepID=A0A844D339_9BURK|nr:S41 family peptidase [Duganella aquatilis]MRW82556.1 hypothetical protein [Duganella aquatilis]
MRHLSSFLLIALSLTTVPACAASAVAPQPGATTKEIYAYQRALRAEAQRLSGSASASPDDLQQALKKYQASLDYLATPQVRDHAQGSVSLGAEFVNVLIPMAQTYARLGMKAQALDALERVLDTLWLPQLEQIASDHAYDSLRNEARFKALLKTSAIPRRLYQAPAIATPYKPVLSTEEKVAGLSLFWAEVRRNFVHFDHVPDLDWNQVYMDYLTKVIAAPTTRDYYQVMMQLAPLLQDGHTNIYPPDALVPELFSRPSLRTVLVEDKVLVQRVGNAALAERVHVGEEIVAIDGEPVQQYAAQRIAPFVSASTAQDRAMRIYSYELLRGDVGKPVALRLRAADGVERTEVLQRSGAYQGPQQFEFKMLPGQIAYLSLGEFESDQGVKLLQQMLPEILKAKGLVLDVRRNGGGSSGNGYAVLSYLSREPFATSSSYVRSDDAVMRAQAGAAINWSRTSWGDETYRNKHPEVYNGPVAVLTSAQTFSAAEDFAVAFRGMKRGIIVGEASGGSTGQPLFLDLPGGGKARICVKRDTYPDGTAFVGVGVLPDVEAHPTVASVRAGTDPVLERALAELGKR